MLATSVTRQGSLLLSALLILPSLCLLIKPSFHEYGIMLRSGLVASGNHRMLEGGHHLEENVVAVVDCLVVQNSDSGMGRLRVLATRLLGAYSCHW